MALLPFIMGFSPPHPYPHHHRIGDQDFGLTLNPDDLLTAAVAPLMSRDYFRPWRQMVAAARDVGSTIKSDRDKFQVNLDVQHFAPDEITVKTGDGYIIVKGKHEEKEDEYGYVSRHFARRYALPDGCNPECVESRLSSDGVLTIVAPRVVPSLKNVRAVPISHTGPVRKDVRDQTPQATNGASK